MNFQIARSLSLLYNNEQKQIMASKIGRYFEIIFK